MGQRERDRRICDRRRIIRLGAGGGPIKLKVGTTFFGKSENRRPKNFYGYQAFPIERGWVLRWMVAPD